MAPGRFRIGLDQIRHRAHPKEFPTPDARDLALAQTIRRTLRQGRKGVPAITPFAAGDLYLGVPLFPRQALLLRLLYGKPSREDRHDLWRLIDSPTPEAGLYPPPGWPRTPITQVCLIMGRRSSKTTLAALVEAYEIYRALHRSRPAAASGVLPTQEIAFINCATSEEQAKVHYRTLMGYLARLDVTPVEGNIDRGLECLLPGGLRILSLHSNARSLRGRTAKVVVFDELAHFQQTGGPMSDEEVYRALAPSVRTFGDRGRILITSSPADPSGVLWDLYQARGTQPGLLVAQFATWEFNPHIRREDLEPEFRRHPAWAASEYGAQFPAQSAAAFLATAVVEAAVHHAPRRADCLDPAQCYFAHLDLGLLHDRTAVAVGHVEVLDGRRVAVVDLVQTWQASKGQPVSVGTVERWIRDLAGRVPLHGVSADPHESSLLLERLSAAGLHTKAIPYSGPRKLALYLRLEDWLLTGQLHLPRDPLLIAELTHLRRQTSASGAALFAAPRSGPVRTDDCADAVAGLLEWLAAPVAGLSHTVRTVDGAW